MGFASLLALITPKELPLVVLVIHMGLERGSGAAGWHSNVRRVQGCLCSWEVEEGARNAVLLWVLETKKICPSEVSVHGLLVNRFTYF